MTDVNVQELLERIAKLEAAAETPEAKTIDVSKPINVPYNLADPKNQYPKTVYHHGRRDSLVVKNLAEEKAAAEKGFKAEAFLADNQLSEDKRLMLLGKAELIKMAREVYDLENVTIQNKKEEIVLAIMAAQEQMAS